MASRVSSSSLPAGLPPRRRRDSSEDFGTSSLGSIAGSAFGGGSSVEGPPTLLGGDISASIAGGDIVIVQDTKPSASTTADNDTAADQDNDDGDSDNDNNPDHSSKNSANQPIHPTDERDSSEVSERISAQTAVADPSLTTLAKAPPVGESKHVDNDNVEGGGGTSCVPPKPIDSLELKSTTSKGSSTNSPSTGRRPFRKRKGSVDFSLSVDDEPTFTSNNTNESASKILPTMDALPSMESLPNLQPPGSPLLMRGSASLSSGQTQGLAIDRMDVQKREAGEAAERVPLKKRKRSLSTGEFSRRSDDNSSHGTFTSQSHRFLVEAFMGGDAGEGLVDPVRRDRFDIVDFDSRKELFGGLEHRSRDRSGSSDVRDRIGSVDVRNRSGSVDVRDRSGSVDVRDRSGSVDMRDRSGSVDVRDRSGSFDFRIRSGRERLESWGGMSDLSIPVQESSVQDSLVTSGTRTAAALAATIYTSLANDLTAVADMDGSESISSFLVNEKIPTKISLQRDGLNSVASTASDSSPAFLHIPTEAEIPSDVQKFVKAAMASVGDTLAEIATAANDAVKDPELNSEISSTASPVIGVSSDAGSKTGSVADTRPRSNSISSLLNISVDYDAVAAAVDAAEAAAGSIDLATFARATKPIAPAAAAPPTKTNSKSKKKTKKRRKLPTRKRARSNSDAQSSCNDKKPPADPLHIPIPKSQMDEKDLEVIRKKARAAAGYIPPSGSADASAWVPASEYLPLRVTSSDRPPLPSKKKAKVDPHTPVSNRTKSDSKLAAAVPRASSTSQKATPVGTLQETPGTMTSSCATPFRTPSSKGQSSQKWDSMFDCLLQFVQDRRTEETKDMTDEEKKDWVWDGNVPTTYKTNDGKALGRWVNNQRSAKSKGVLKEERETRLVSAGLKWSVLASNSWNEMLEELRIYVSAQTKDGGKWDGNVPTNYRIKNRNATGSKDDEDKNLGRWVNRQRSLYQAGKLRKDRQQALEKVGLKWSMLATTSWESMFETLCEYIDVKAKENGGWDGNVPANYRTGDNPPRALGRWINRQRSAYGKDKLKREYVEKLNKIGLKWSVHERRPVSTPAAGQSSNKVVTTPPSSAENPQPLPAPSSTAATKPIAKTPLKPAAMPAAKPTGKAPPKPPPEVPTKAPGDTPSGLPAKVLSKPSADATSKHPANALSDTSSKLGSKSSNTTSLTPRPKPPPKPKGDPPSKSSAKTPPAPVSKPLPAAPAGVPSKAPALPPSEPPTKPSAPPNTPKKEGTKAPTNAHSVALAVAASAPATKSSVPAPSQKPPEGPPILPAKTAANPSSRSHANGSVSAPCSDATARKIRVAADPPSQPPAKAAAMPPDKLSAPIVSTKAPTDEKVGSDVSPSTAGAKSIRSSVKSSDPAPTPLAITEHSKLPSDSAAGLSSKPPDKTVAPTSIQKARAPVVKTPVRPPCKPPVVLPLTPAARHPAVATAGKKRETKVLTASPAEPPVQVEAGPPLYLLAKPPFNAPTLKVTTKSTNTSAVSPSKHSDELPATASSLIVASREGTKPTSGADSNNPCVPPSKRLSEPPATTAVLAPHPETSEVEENAPAGPASMPSANPPCKTQTGPSIPPPGLKAREEEKKTECENN